MKILSNVFGWFSGLSQGKLIGGGVLLLLGVGGFFLAKYFINESFDRAEEGGANKAIVEGQKTTLEQIGDANEAVEELRNPGSCAKYNECLLSTRNDASVCQRYLPNQPVSGDEDNPCGGGNGSGN